MDPRNVAVLAIRRACVKLDRRFNEAVRQDSQKG
jgi:hypothetical protein